jgi:hypothetical protein
MWHITYFPYNEHRQNLKHKTNRNGFHQMFNGGETNLRAIVAHNATKDAGNSRKAGQLCWCMGI